MALKYEPNYNHSAIIGDKTIYFKPWTTKNEKDYLLAIDSKDNIDNTLLFNMLIKPCLKDKNLSLTLNEQKMLMIEIRKKSIGETFSLNFTCKKCKNVNQIDIELDKIIKYKPDNFKSVTIDNMVFEFKNSPSENLKARLDNCENSIEYSFIELLIHISSIEINGEIEDTFTFNELTEFIEDLPSSVFDKLFKEFKDMNGSLEFELKSHCMICNEENDLNISSIPNFLWT